MYDAEKILKSIFQFRQPSTIGDAIKSAATMMTGAKLMTSLGAKAGQSIANAKTPNLRGNANNIGEETADKPIEDNKNNTNTKDESEIETDNNKENSKTSTAKTSQGGNGSENMQENTKDYNSTPSSGGSAPAKSKWTQRHPKATRAFKVGGRALGKTLGKTALTGAKLGTSIGIAALGIGTNNFLNSAQVAMGTYESLTATGRGIKQRKYVQSLNNNLYLAGDKYDKRIQNIAAKITKEQGDEIEKRIFDKLRKDGMGENEAKEKAHEQAQRDIYKKATDQVNAEMIKAIKIADKSRIKDQELREIAMILQQCIDLRQKLGDDKDKAEEHTLSDVAGIKA